MTTAEPATKSLRQGSDKKRRAILVAARELFLHDGFERTSVDAIASGAGVSKRTIYDYFGDKEKLLLAVVDEAISLLLESVKSALDTELGSGDAIPDDLQEALLAFVKNLSVSALGSPEYSALLRLVATEAVHLEDLKQLSVTKEPEAMLAERFAAFGRAGLLTVPKPDVAADHFVALTVGLVSNESSPFADSSAARNEEVFSEGVAAFLRAYGSSREA